MQIRSDPTSILFRPRHHHIISVFLPFWWELSEKQLLASSVIVLRTNLSKSVGYVAPHEWCIPHSAGRPAMSSPPLSAQLVPQVLRAKAGCGPVPRKAVHWRHRCETTMKSHLWRKSYKCFLEGGSWFWAIRKHRGIWTKDYVINIIIKFQVQK